MRKGYTLIPYTWICFGIKQLDILISCKINIIMYICTHTNQLEQPMANGIAAKRLVLYKKIGKSLGSTLLVRIVLFSVLYLRR